MADKNMSYLQACAAMQSGVAFDQANGSKDGSSKHLRVGINSALSSHCALVKLLIAKGLITEAEYLEAVRLEMVAEVDRYERLLSERVGVEVKLG